MKTLFTILIAAVLIGSAFTYLTEPRQQSEVPILYWGSGISEVRIEQLQIFHQWLIDNGHVTEEGKPILELRLDQGGRGKYKQMIQGVSGVASDLHYGTMPYMERAGMLADLSEMAQRLGIDESTTYSTIEADFMVEGRQYGFPMYIYIPTLWVNLDTFEKYGLDPPPRRWDIATFERIGKEFIRRANKPDQRQTFFFLGAITSGNNQRFIRSMHRDLGLDDFNETMTRCTLDDERYIKVLKRVYQWTHVDRILPTAADEVSFVTDASYSSGARNLFYKGNYAMIASSRRMLFQLRQFSQPPRLSVSFFPADEFPNTMPVAIAMGIYELSRYKREAELFLQFLRSREHNMHVVERAYGMPPIPKYTELDAFKFPPEHPNEWGVHEAQAEALKTIAITRPHSPFVPLEPSWLAKKQALEKVLAGTATPEEAAREAAQKINLEIQYTVADSRRLRALYEERIALQERIDRCRASGRPVPVEWIKNPFHRRYFSFKGRSTHEG